MGNEEEEGQGTSTSVLGMTKGNRTKSTSALGKTKGNRKSSTEGNERVHFSNDKAESTDMDKKEDGKADKGEVNDKKEKKEDGKKEKREVQGKDAKRDDEKNDLK